MWEEPPHSLQNQIVFLKIKRTICGQDTFLGVIPSMLLWGDSVFLKGFICLRAFAGLWSKLPTFMLA